MRGSKTSGISGTRQADATLSGACVPRRTRGISRRFSRIQKSRRKEKMRYVRAFDFLPASPEKSRALIELASAEKAANAIAKEALTRLKGSNDPAVKTALEGELTKAKGTPQFVALVKDFGIQDQPPALLDTALKLSGTPAAAEALRLIAEDPKGDAILRGTLAGPQERR